MKPKFYLSLLIIIAASTTYAQEFKKFKVGLGAGYAVPGGTGTKAGVLLYLEPGYRLNDDLIVNLRLETALVARGYADAVSSSMDIAAIKSYTLNGQYYFSKKTFRPFLGVGAGLYSLAAATLDNSGNGGLAAETKFGLYPRGGFDLGHFNFSVDYNLVPGTKIGTTEIKNSYLSFRIGASFGGGKRK